MRRRITLIFLLVFAVICKTAASPPVTARTENNGNIWIYSGGWCFWNDADTAGGISLDAKRSLFLSKTPYLKPLTPDSPIPDLHGGVNVYAVDSTPLYFSGEPVELGSIYGFDRLDIISGVISAEEVRAESGVFIGAGCNISVLGGLSSGGAFECFGGTVNAGAVYARKIWLDSADSPLNINVSGSVQAEYYTQCGGSVTIGGRLSAESEAVDVHALLTVNSDYAYHNASKLTVTGDISGLGGGGSIEIGGGSAYGGMDETALTSFVYLRSDKKAQNFSVYDNPPPSTLPFADVVVSSHGDIQAFRQISIFSGSTAAEGSIRTLYEEEAVRVYGGFVRAFDEV